MYIGHKIPTYFAHKFDHPVSENLSLKKTFPESSFRTEWLILAGQFYFHFRVIYFLAEY